MLDVIIVSVLLCHIVVVHEPVGLLMHTPPPPPRTGRGEFRSSMKDMITLYCRGVVSWSRNVYIQNQLR